MTYRYFMFPTETEANALVDALAAWGVTVHLNGPIYTEFVNGGEPAKEWEVRIAVPPQRRRAPVHVPTATELDEDDYGRSTIWDELEESRD